MDPRIRDEIAARARIRHDHIMAKRQRAQRLADDLVQLRWKLRNTLEKFTKEMLAVNADLTALGDRLSSYQAELAQEESTVVLTIQDTEPRPGGGTSPSSNRGAGA